MFILLTEWDGSLSPMGQHKGNTMSAEQKIKQRIKYLSEIKNSKLQELISQSIDELTWVLGLLKQERK